MRRLFILLTAAFMVIAGAGTALADPPFETPGPPTEFPGNGERPDWAPGPPEKVDICHLTGEGSYHLISIPEQAVEAHLAHGDAFPGELDEENQKGENGRLDCLSIALFEESFELDPETVLDNGGVYDNEEVEDAIAAGYSGMVDVYLTLDTNEVLFDFWFENLPIGEIFTVYLDDDGGSPGPFTVLGTFTVDAFGEGTFQYTASPGFGTFTWSFWVNQSTPPASVLQTGDITFTID